MRCRRLIRNRVSRWGHAGLISLTLFGFAIGTVGIPVPVPVSSSSNPEQFICQGHGCGCQTAEHCWKSCCCFSPKKRLEWAAKNDVPVSVALADQLLDNAAGDPAASTCASPALLAESAATVSQQRGSELASSPRNERRSGRPDDSTSSDENTDGVTWYSVILAGKCQGAGSTLLLISDPLGVPAPRTNWQATEIAQRDVPEPEPLLCSLTWAPPVPPG